VKQPKIPKREKDARGGSGILPAYQRERERCSVLVMRRAILLGCLLLSPVGADIFIKRTVDALTIPSLNVTLSPGCTTNDMHGSSQCDLHWGSNYTMTVTASQDIVAGSTFSVDAKLGTSPDPIKFTCPACSGNCTVDIPISSVLNGITIPLMTKHLHMKMPDCPITAKSKSPFTKMFKLAAHSPVPFKRTPPPLFPSLRIPYAAPSCKLLRGSLSVFGTLTSCAPAVTHGRMHSERHRQWYAL
jgi:hypothetical protein